MNYWLFKSEPHIWSWEDQAKKGTECWDGIRNYQARNNMAAMKNGDRGFFYHSGEEKAICGVVEVVREFYPDHTDKTGKFGMVDVKALMPAKTRITLADVKANSALKDMVLVNNTRLSVQPVTKKEWGILCKMAGVKA